MVRGIERGSRGRGYADCLVGNFSTSCINELPAKIARTEDVAGAVLLMNSVSAENLHTKDDHGKANWVWDMCLGDGRCTVERERGGCNSAGGRGAADASDN
jgi:hypothetical protein